MLRPPRVGRGSRVLTGPGEDPSPLSEPRRSVFPANITLGVLRVLLGIWFIAAGITKLAVPAVWDVWASLLGGADFPFYSVSLWLGPVVEMLTGLLLVSGYFSRIAGLIAACQMTIAVYVHSASSAVSFPFQTEARILGCVALGMSICVAWRGGGAWARP